jgi:hypothetical protein
MVRASRTEIAARRAARGEALTSRQETSVQNSTSNPSLHSSTTSASTSAGQATERAALARAYERARDRVLAGDPLAAELFSVLTSCTDEFPDEKTMPCGPAVSDAVGAPGLGVRVTLDELLPVCREPIEWVLARAERQAQGNPADLAALARVRAAYQSRLTWIGTGGALGQATPNLRPTDLLTVAGLFASSIDPTFAQRASAGLRDSFHNALTAVIPLVQAHSPSMIEASRSPATLWFLNAIADTPAPFGPPRAVHPPAPACRCRHGHPL